MIHLGKVGVSSLAAGIGLLAAAIRASCPKRAREEGRYNRLMAGLGALRAALSLLVLLGSWPCQALERGGPSRAVYERRLPAGWRLPVLVPALMATGAGISAPAAPGSLSMSAAAASAPAAAAASAADSPQAAAAQAVVPAPIPAAQAAALPRGLNLAPAVSLAPPLALGQARAAGAALGEASEPGDDAASWQAAASVFEAGVARAQALPAGATAVAARPGRASRMAAAALALPLGAAHSDAGIGPALGALGYGVGNALAFAFPFPQMYQTFVRGNAEGFPTARAFLGAAGTVALGVVNAPVLDKPLWGVLHIFVGLGMVAPYFLGRFLKRRGEAAGSYMTPAFLQGLPLRRRLAHRVGGDSALRRSIALGLALSAASAAVYSAAAAAVPVWLTAHLSAAVVPDVLLAIQMLKGVLFVGVFAPDMAALLRGKPVHGFSRWFTLTFLMSVASFTLWSFQAAFAAEVGPIRDQYLVSGVRNLCETIAALLSWWAMTRPPRPAAKP